MILTARQKKRRAAEAKGKRLELQIKAHLEAQGWRVETAPKVVMWIWSPQLQAKVPIVRRHDFYNVWDGTAVRGLTRSFYQVTVLGHVSHKREKIRASGFPTTSADRLYAYVGRPRVWRMLVGPDFAMPGETFTCSAPEKVAVEA